jgi:hypothetical protein
MSLGDKRASLLWQRALVTQVKSLITPVSIDVLSEDEEETTPSPPANEKIYLMKNFESFLLKKLKSEKM